MSGICRVCHLKTDFLIPLFTEKEDNTFEIFEEGAMLEKCSEIRVLDLPNYSSICLKCDAKIKYLYNFKEKCIATVNALNLQDTKYNLNGSRANFIDEMDQNEITACKTDKNVPNDDIEYTQNIEDLPYANENISDESKYFKYQCTNCSGYFSTKESYWEHIEICIDEDLAEKSKQMLQHSMKRYVCLDCKLKFFTGDSLFLHLKAHKKNEDNQKSIRKVVKDKSENDFRDNDSSSSGVCPFCGKDFINRGKLKIHFSKDHSSIKRYKCNF